MYKYKTDDIKQIQPIKKEFLISWYVTGWCNFKCPYCISSRDREPFTPEQTLVSILTKLNDFVNLNVERDRKIVLRLFGGEPGFYDWPLLLEKLSRLNKLAMSTNFSNNLDYYKNLYDYCYSRNIQLVLNCAKHPESRDFIKKMSEITNWCKEKGYKEPINTFVVNDDFDFSILNEFKNNGITRLRLSVERSLYNKTLALKQETLNKIYKYNKDYENATTGRTLRVIFKNGFHKDFVNQSDFNNLMSNGGFKPDGYKCSAGMNNIALWANGDVVYSRCEFLRDKRVGNILTDDIKLLKDYMVCELNEKCKKDDLRCPLCHNTTIFREENN